MSSISTKNYFKTEELRTPYFVADSALGLDGNWFKHDGNVDLTKIESAKVAVFVKLGEDLYALCNPLDKQFPIQLFSDVTTNLF